MGAPSDISKYCRTSKTSLEPLSPYCTSSISDRPFHLSSFLSCSSTKLAPFLQPSACIYPFTSSSFSSHCLPLSLLLTFFLLPPPLSQVLPSLPRPLSSVPAGYSPDLDFHFPSLPRSYPFFLTVASSPTCFLPSSFHHSIPFLSMAFPTLHFHSMLPWGFQGGLKRSWLRESACACTCHFGLIYA